MEEAAVGLDRTRSAAIARIIASHDAQGDKLLERVSSLVLDETSGCPREGLLALLLKLSDLMDTTASRAPSEGSPLLKKRSQRAIAIARRAITSAHVLGGGHTISIKATPRNVLERENVRVYLDRLERSEFAPIRSLLIEQNLPHDLQTEIDDSLIVPPADAAPGASPGLQWFGSDSVSIFRGRESETDALVKHVAVDDAALSVVLGSSGSGKSSLLAAGVFPRLSSMGWRCNHLRPDVNSLGSPCWRRADEEGIQFDGLGSLAEQLRPAYEANVEQVGVIIALDQLESLIHDGSSAPTCLEWLRSELEVVIGENAWMATVVAYRAEFETVLGPIIDAAVSADRPPRVYLELLPSDKALAAFEAAPEIASATLPSDFGASLMHELAKQTYRDYNQPGIYPPYIQVAIEAVSGSLDDGALAAADAHALLDDGRALVGNYLHRRLQTLQDASRARSILLATVGTFTDAALDKGRATIARLSVITGLPLADVRHVVGELVAIRLLRSLDPEEVEIAHDYVSDLVVKEMTEGERRERAVWDALQLASRDLRVSHGLLAADLALSLFQRASVLHSRLSDEQRYCILLSRWAEQSPFDRDWGTRPGWWAVQGLDDAWVRERLAASAIELQGCARDLRKGTVNVLTGRPMHPSHPSAFLQDQEPDVACLAIEAIAVRDGELALESLMALLENAQYINIRIAAARALGLIAHPNSVEALNRAASAGDRLLRIAAQGSLLASGDTAYLDELVRRLHSGSDTVRAAAIGAIRFCREPQLLPIDGLEAALVHSRLDVGVAAADTLAGLLSSDELGAVVQRKSVDLSPHVAAALDWHLYAPAFMKQRIRRLDYWFGSS